MELVKIIIISWGYYHTVVYSPQKYELSAANCVETQLSNLFPL